MLDRIRANPTGRLALKIGVGVLGTIVVVVGIILIPFPGPVTTREEWTLPE